MEVKERYFALDPEKRLLLNKCYRRRKCLLDPNSKYLIRKYTVHNFFMDFICDPEGSFYQLSTSVDERSFGSLTNFKEQIERDIIAISEDQLPEEDVEDNGAEDEMRFNRVCGFIEREHRSPSMAPEEIKLNAWWRDINQKFSEQRLSDEQLDKYMQLCKILLNQHV